MAKPTYLKVSPIPGKFYVSEGWRANNPEGVQMRSQFEHGNQLAQMVLAGPFDTRMDAENWNTKNANGRADIWQL